LGIDGEIEQLREFVGPFSARAAQVSRNRDQLETAWRAAHPDQEPGPQLVRSWTGLAWAKDRPDKIPAVSADTLHQRWLAELSDLGYGPGRGTAGLGAVRAGSLDRDALAQQVLSRLAARRSAWNQADVRGEVEQALARTGLMADAAVRIEVAEDITARAAARCVPLIPGPGVPEHIRALTSPHVVRVEADLTSRIAARTTVAGQDPAEVRADDGLEGLDSGQRDAVALLAGVHQLVLVEGAAGVGKTTVLAATPGRTHPMTAQHTDDDLLTITEAAAILRTPVATLRYWRHLGTGPRSFRLGRRVLYRADDLHQWIQAQHDGPAA
jgi:predicted DNA-binding transcriptional regulator AlpA